MFNELKLWEQTQGDGKLQQHVIYEGKPRRGVREPRGTKSQVVWYYDKWHRKVALVHQYLRPDGTVGGAGRPDPKRVWKDGVIYTCLEC
jgi:hypothetical protein